MLHTGVDAESNVVPCDKGRVETFLDTLKSLVINPCEADHVGSEPTVRVYSPFFIYEFKTRDAKTIDTILLTRAEVSFDPNEASIRG